MATTIQIEERTLNLLKELKRKFNSESYEEVIKKLIFKYEKTPKSMFASNPKLKEFKENERVKFHEF